MWYVLVRSGGVFDLCEKLVKGKYIPTNLK